MQFVTTLVSFPVVSLLTMSIAAKNTVAIAAISGEGEDTVFGIRND